MTNDYRIILPLMFSVAVSLLVSQKLEKDSVYNLGLARHGIRLDRGRDLEVLSSLTVDEVMCKQTDTIPEQASAEEASAILTATHHHGLPVVDSDNHLTGILTLQDLEKSTAGKVVDLCTREVEVAFADERLSNALRRMSLRNVGRLPVVAREDPRRLVGILRRADIIQAYDVALTRRTAQRHREMEVRLDALTPVNVNINHIGVETASSAANRAMKEIPFPKDCVVATVRRGNQVFIPRGETIIRPGDVLVVVASGAALDSATQLCQENE
jgi:chloride channel protein, CIC family